MWKDLLNVAITTYVGRHTEHDVWFNISTTSFFIFGLLMLKIVSLMFFALNRLVSRYITGIITGFRILDFHLIWDIRIEICSCLKDRTFWHTRHDTCIEEVCLPGLAYALSEFIWQTHNWLPDNEYFCWRWSRFKFPWDSPSRLRLQSVQVFIPQGPLKWSNNYSQIIKLPIILINIMCYVIMRTYKSFMAQFIHVMWRKRSLLYFDP